MIAGLAAMDATLSLPERQVADLLERRVETESVVLGRLDVLDTLRAKGADEACASTPISVDVMRNGGAPRSSSLVIADGASFVWSVENTR